jgi:hypothetical protein
MKKIRCHVSSRRKLARTWMLGFKEKKGRKKLDTGFQAKESWKEIGFCV